MKKSSTKIRLADFVFSVTKCHKIRLDCLSRYENAPSTRDLQKYIDCYYIASCIVSSISWLMQVVDTVYLYTIWPRCYRNTFPLWLRIRPYLLCVVVPLFDVHSRRSTILRALPIVFKSTRMNPVQNILSIMSKWCVQDALVSNSLPKSLYWELKTVQFSTLYM